MIGNLKVKYRLGYEKYIFKTHDEVTYLSLKEATGIFRRSVIVLPVYDEHGSLNLLAKRAGN